MRLIATTSEDNAVLDEIAEIIREKGVSLDVTKYEHGFGFTVWSVNDLDNVSAAANWTHNERLQFMEQYGDKLGGATEDSWVKLESFVDDYIQNLLKENNEYVESNYDEIDKTKFYLNACGGGWVRMVYYNPDSNAGGQFVYDLLSDRMISDAADESKTEEEFWHYLYSVSNQTLMDINQHDFMSAAVEFFEKPCDLEGQSSDTMEALKKWAYKSLNPNG